MNASTRILPGFHLSVGFAALYLTLLVAVPMSACLLKVFSLSWDEFAGAVWNERARAAYLLTLGASLAAAAVNVVLGLVVAWALVRYDFPGRSWLDALVDLPLALPTAVAGLVYSSLYAESGWLGQFLVPLGIQAAYSRLGIVLVLMFVSLPLVVRTVQPVLESLEADVEEAAALLGASRWQTFVRVVLPALAPALVAGFALAFARSLGEYGAVVFVSGNLQGTTEIAPVLIVAKLEDFRYAEATAIAAVLLVASLATLAGIHLLEQWSKQGHD